MERVTREQAEQAIIQRFVRAYSNQCDIQLENIIARDKPDFEATIWDSGEKIGIEVTGLYQDDREAMINYNEIPDWDNQPLHIESIIDELNKRLEKKSTSSQQYRFDGRILLAIWVGSFTFYTYEDFDAISPFIKVPESKFSEIWLILRKDNSNEPYIMALLPQGNRNL